MNGKSRVSIAALALLTVGVLSLPAITQAHKRTFATTVTAAAQKKNQVQGSVHSAKARCLPQRSVALYSSTGVLEASATTDNQGSFKIMSKKLPAGIHYVNVKKRVLLRNHLHRHKCGFAKTSFLAP